MAQRGIDNPARDVKHLFQHDRAKWYLVRLLVSMQLLISEPTRHRSTAFCIDAPLLTRLQTTPSSLTHTPTSVLLKVSLKLHSYTLSTPDIISTHPSASDSATR